MVKSLFFGGLGSGVSPLAPKSWGDTRPIFGKPAIPGHLLLLACKPCREHVIITADYGLKKFAAGRKRTAYKFGIVHLRRAAIAVGREGTCIARTRRQFSPA